MIMELSIVSGLIGLAYTAFKTNQIYKYSEGPTKMKEIAANIREGALTYLKKQYSILAIFVIILAVILYTLISQQTAYSFIAGAICSSLAGFIGMNIATISNVRTTEAAKKGIQKALEISFSAGLVMSLFAASVGLLGITILYLIYQDPNAIFGFALGASSVALFARVGGGIFTKAADVGADLVGKVEKHIPEDDPRNPAVIADNVGDNVGDIAGMGADLFESYVGAIIAAMALGVVAFGINGLYLPIALSAIGIIASILGSLFVKKTSDNTVHSALDFGLIIASGIIALAAYPITLMWFQSVPLYLTIVVGLLTGILIGWNTNRYTSEKEKYAKSIANTAKTGVAPTIIQGFVVGMRSTKNTLILIALSIIITYTLGSMTGIPNGGLYGISIAAVGMLSTLGIALAIDAFGPVVDNAGGIAEMAGLPEKVRKHTDELDAAGNTTAAIGKGFAIGSAALTALALFTSYASTANLDVINIVNPNVLIGLLIGAMLPFYFTSLTMNSVGKAAFEMVEEVRRQFKEIKGLMQGKAQPNYKRCIEISTETALKEMIAPGLLAIVAPLIMGLVFGVQALGGLLVGSLVSGVSLANMLSNSGGAWDNAKKYLEARKENTKDWHERHDATVIGDTVGDPFKDTSGPALNILIKLMTIVSLVFVPLFLAPIF